jgi:hypothetical protein
LPLGTVTVSDILELFRFALRIWLNYRVCPT